VPVMLKRARVPLPTGGPSGVQLVAVFQSVPELFQVKVWPDAGAELAAKRAQVSNARTSGRGSVTDDLIRC
jgi:hypothetical protein